MHKSLLGVQKVGNTFCGKNVNVADLYFCLGVWAVGM